MQYFGEAREGFNGYPDPTVLEHGSILSIDDLMEEFSKYVCLRVAFCRDHNGLCCRHRDPLAGEVVPNVMSSWEVSSGCHLFVSCWTDVQSVRFTTKLTSCFVKLHS